MDNIHAKYLTEFKIPVVAEGPTFKLFSDNALFVYNSLWHEFEFVGYVSDELAERWKLSPANTMGCALAEYVANHAVSVVAEGPDFKLLSDNALFRPYKKGQRLELVGIISDALAERWKQNANPIWSLVCLD